MDLAVIWIVLGLALILAEFALPGFIVVFFGIGALVTGLALAAGLPEGNGVPFLVFSVVSVGTLVGLRAQFQSWFKGELGSSGEDSAGIDGDFLGHEATVESGFDEAAPGRGTVSFRGAPWSARSDEPRLRANEIVRIDGRSGSILHVRREVVE